MAIGQTVRDNNVVFIWTYEWNATKVYSVNKGLDSDTVYQEQRIDPSPLRYCAGTTTRVRLCVFVLVHCPA